MKKLLLVLAMGLWLSAAVAADKDVSRKTPPGVKLPPPEMVVPKPGETPPPLGEPFKKTHKNLCPACGRDRSLCYAESMKAKKTGKGKVCDVYRDDYVSGAARPVACPVCRQALKERAGIDLPPASDASFWGNWDNPAWRAWIDLRFESTAIFQKAVRDVLRDHPYIRRIEIVAAIGNDGLLTDCVVTNKDETTLRIVRSGEAPF